MRDRVSKKTNKQSERKTKREREKSKGIVIEYVVEQSFSDLISEAKSKPWSNKIESIKTTTTTNWW